MPGLRAPPASHGVCTFIVGKVLLGTRREPLPSTRLHREAARRAGQRLGLPTRVSTADVRLHKILPNAKGFLLGLRAWEREKKSSCSYECGYDGGFEGVIGGGDILAQYCAKTRAGGIVGTLAVLKG